MGLKISGTVIRHSNHGDHATVVLAPDLEDARNDAWAHQDPANGVAGDMLTLKVNAATAAAPEVQEGAEVTITFAAVKGEPAAKGESAK